MMVMKRRLLMSDSEGSSERLQFLLNLPPDRQRLALRKLSASERLEFRHHWRLFARVEQLPPEGDWRLWLILAGRGFGKTRAGAEWVREVANSNPDARIALVASSLGEARSVMVEGESGLMATCPATRQPRFEASLRRLVWPNGAQATLYSAAEPDCLRGPQHSHAWCDEIAKWDNSAERSVQSWNNLLMGLRLGEEPRVLATTTRGAFVATLAERPRYCGDAGADGGQCMQPARAVYQGYSTGIWSFDVGAAGTGR